MPGFESGQRCRLLSCRRAAQSMQTNLLLVRAVCSLKMPRGDHCCVPGCSNRRSKRPELSFHTFPSSQVMRRRWIQSIRRDIGPNFQVTANTVVCSAHFELSCYYPSVNVEVGETSRRHCRRLKKDSVPSLFSFRLSLYPARPSRDDRLAVGAERAVELEERKLSQRMAAETESERKMREELEEARAKIGQLEERVATLSAEKENLKAQLFRFDNVKDNKELEFLTGLNKKQWDAVWTFLDVRSSNDVLSARAAKTESSGRTYAQGSGRHSRLSMEDELLLTLMRLRLGRLQEELAYTFGVSESTVSTIFNKWINFLYLRLGSIPIWPDWEDVAESMPKSFRDTYPDTFIIIDATEIRCQVPSSLSLQSKLYSAYKSHTTVKGLVGIAPNGAFTFISELFTGSISDRQLVIESGILSLLEDVPPGKRVMADRGFEIQDLLVKANLILNIPPFKGSRPFLPLAEVIKTQKIASVRIHVERAIGRVKRKFHILSKDVPLSLFGCINQIWTVCCLLTNFLGPLINDPE